MHSRSRTGINSAIAIAIIIIVIIIAVYVGINLTSITPPLQVSGVSINPNSINVNANATLSFTVKNNDGTNPHTITVKFNVTSVFFYLSGNLLPYGIDGLQYRNIVLQSSEQSTYSFKVIGVLTGGAQSSTYSIRIDFYNENSTRFDTETQSLTVTNS